MTAPSDGPTYQDKLADLTQVGDDELAGLETEIAQAFEEADQADDLDGMNQAADALDQVKAEAANRGLDQTDPDADGDTDTTDDPSLNPDAEADMAVAAAADEPETPAADAPAGGDAPAAVADAAPEVSPDVPETADTTVTAENEEEAKVDTPSVPEDRQPLATPVAASNVIVAAADVDGVASGAPFETKESFVRALIAKADAIRDAQGSGEKVRVATVRAAAVSEDRTLDLSDLAGNQEKIAQAIGGDMASRKALLASGGYCAPLESRYDVFGIGTTDRPVRSALPGFRAQRGGIRWITPPSLAGVTGSTGVWTATTDATPGGATKNKLIVACGAEQTVSISAITLEMQFGNFMARAYPEMVARNTDLGMIAQARLAETTLLTSMGTLSTAVTTSNGAKGVARDWPLQVAQAAAAYRARHRLEADAPLRVIVPAWVRDAVRDDIAWSKSPTTDNVLGESDGTIEGYLSARNVNVAWHLDDTQYFLAQAAGALNAYPTTFSWLIFAEGTFLFLDGGTLDIGVVRDSTLVGTNDYIQFTENFEGVAKVGLESLKVTTQFATTPVIGATGA